MEHLRNLKGGLDKSIIILGATATGKSKVAVYLAEKFPFEIISADSMQFYKGMDIGTDKVSSEVRKAIPHHFIDIITVEEEFSVAQFKKGVVKILPEIYGRKRIPLIVGGSGLYIRVLTLNFPVEVSSPPDSLLREELSKISLQELRNLAECCDPVATERIGTHDKKRLIRVIEYFRATGKKISDLENTEPLLDFLKIGLYKERDKLYKDIDERVEHMFEKGFVDEVKRLKETYPHWSKTALQAIGYKEVLNYLEGQVSLYEAKEITKKRTRNFAKRQITWFKKEKGLIWFDSTNLENILPDVYRLVREFIYES